VTAVRHRTPAARSVPYIKGSSVHKMLRRTGHREPQGSNLKGTTTWALLRVLKSALPATSPRRLARARPSRFARDPAALLPLYRAMVLTRQFDLKAIAMQRTGQIGTFASALGQEAIGVGVATAMRATTCWCRRTAIMPRSLCGASR
jgi:hypothetical protein